MTSSQKPAEPVTSKYTLEFNAQAYKEWQKLDSTIRLQFAKKLKERLVNPKVESDKLRDMPNRYKIKLRAAGYRLVYDVVDRLLIVTVVAVGKREKSNVYTSAVNRIV